jgi:hypothetical protein
MIPSREMALQRLMEASASMEHQFEKDAYRRPVLFLLKKAREAAIEAYDALVYRVDPMDAPMVRQLQFEIRRYDDLVGWCRQIISEGKEAEQLLKEADRMEMAKAVIDPESAAELRALGVTTNEDTYDDR